MRPMNKRCVCAAPPGASILPLRPDQQRGRSVGFGWRFQHTDQPKRHGSSRHQDRWCGPGHVVPATDQRRQRSATHSADSSTRNKTECAGVDVNRLLKAVIHGTASIAGISRIGCKSLLQLQLLSSTVSRLSGMRQNKPGSRRSCVLRSFLCDEGDVGGGAEQRFLLLHEADQVEQLGAPGGVRHARFEVRCELSRALHRVEPSPPET